MEPSPRMWGVRPRSSGPNPRRSRRDRHRLRRSAASLDEHAAQDLPRRGLRDLVDELNLPDPLVRRDAVGNELLQLLRRHGQAPHDEGLRHFRAGVIGARNDGDVRDGGMRHQHGLELGGRDLVTVVLDELLDAIRRR